MQIVFVSYDHFTVTSQKVGFQRLRSRKSSEILKLVARILAMVCCRSESPRYIKYFKRLLAHRIIGKYLSKNIRKKVENVCLTITVCPQLWFFTF